MTHDVLSATDRRVLEQVLHSPASTAVREQIAADVRRERHVVFTPAASPAESTSCAL